MRLEWVIMAEGLAQDAKAAISAISIGQNVAISPTLPFITKRALLAHLIEDDDAVKTGDQLTYRVSFISPTDKTLNAVTASASVGSFAWPDLPRAIDLPVEMILNCPEYGRYRFEVEVTLPDAVVLSETIDFWIRESPAPGQSVSERIAGRSTFV